MKQALSKISNFLFTPKLYQKFDSLFHGYRFYIFIIVLIIVITGGILVRQYFGAPKEETKTSEEAAKAETADWKIYRNEGYGFKMKYPSDILFTPEQVQYASVLRSFSTTNIEESPVYDLAVHVDNIKVSALKDAQNRIKDLPAYLEGSGPYEEQIGGRIVYVTLTKLYGGLEGLTRNYYFPKFVLSFSYANNAAENRFKNIEQQMLSTFRFLE